MSERRIIATCHRHHKPLWIRRYARLDTAMPRALQLFILEGEPSDVVAFSHADTGLEIGTIKMHVGGKTTANWLWDEKPKRATKEPPRLRAVGTR